MSKRIDISGKKYNMLTVIEYSYTHNGRAYWKCKCDCGNETFVNSQYIKNGSVKSCGCLKTLVQQSEEVIKKKTKTLINSLVEGTSLILLNDNIRTNNKSGVRGVSWSEKKGKWYACIGFQGRNINLGYYDDINDAHKARKLAENQIWGTVKNMVIKE